MSLINERIAELEALAFRSAPDWEVTAKFQQEGYLFLKLKEKSWERAVTLRFTDESLEDDFFEGETAVFRDKGEAWLWSFFKEQLPKMDDGTERIIRSDETKRKFINT